jgi:predicted dienelactone hydrolase
MRTLEIVLILILVARILVPLIWRARWIEWISVAALGVMGLQLFFEGYRWQMIPLYGITLGLGIFSIWRLTHPKSDEKALSMGLIAQTIGGLLILGIAILPPVLLPIPKTPNPTGPYAIGTTTLMLVDESREELFSGKSGEPRRIMVKIWYPAEKEPGAEAAPWLEHMEVMGPAIASHLGLPAFFLEHVKYAKAHAIAEAPISGTQAQYPIILFSHGWGGFRAQNTYQVEELASHGYVVAAPDHAYGAIASVYPDGSVAMNNPAALPYEASITDFAYLTAAQTLGEQWAGDLGFILDTLEALEADDPAGQLTHRLDFTQVGVMGHSTGGGAAIQFCGSDDRCQAVLGMDPYMDPVAFEVLDAGLDQPYLAMFSAVWAEDRSRNNSLYEELAGHSSGEGYRYYIEQTAHYDFTDMPAFSPLAPYLGLKGPLDAKQVSKVINAYTLAFFGHYFNGESGELLEQPSPEFPEMIYWR